MPFYFLRKYGVETTVDFTLLETDGVDLKTDAAHASGDTKIMKDEGAETNTTNGFTDEGQGYSLVVSATEMQAARVVIYVVDQSTKAWLDDSIIIETYGHANAMHAIDFSDSVRAGLTALPNAAADAAGGLPVSDAGGLDMDAILSRIGTPSVTLADDIAALPTAAEVNAEMDTALNTAIPGSPAANSINERIAAIDDLTQSGGSGDLAAILGDTNELQGDWVNGGRLDLLLDAIKAVTDALPDSGALSSLATAANLATVDTVVDTLLEALCLNSTTIATLASQTSFTLTAGSDDDDAYNGCLVLVRDASTATQRAVGIASDYTGSTKTLTLKADPAIFTMAVGDTVYILPPSAMQGAANVLDDLNDPTAAAIRAEIDSNSTQLAAIVADTNELQGDWTNGGRLDLILDDVLLDTGTTIPGVLGTPSVTLADDIAALPTAAEVNAEVDTALNTAIPGSPAANSINERIAAIDDLTQSGGGGDLAAILGDTNELQGNQPTNWSSLSITAGGLVATGRTSFKCIPSYNTSSNVFRILCWLEDEDGTVINPTTITSVLVYDHAKTEKIGSGGSSAWDTSPTENTGSTIYAQLDDASAEITAGEVYFIEATIDGSVYVASFTAAATA